MSKKFLLILIAVVLVNSFIFGITATSGTSMEPTIQDDSYVLAEKNLIPKKINKGDIVLVKEKEGHKTIIKRVVGMPGDVIHIAKDGMTINGKAYTDEFGNAYKEKAPYMDKDITLKDDEYFVLGDNREVSYDSRYIGPVEKEQITGKVVCVF